VTYRGVFAGEGNVVFGPTSDVAMTGRVSRTKGRVGAVNVLIVSPRIQPRRAGEGTPNTVDLLLQDAEDPIDDFCGRIDLQRLREKGDRRALIIRDLKSNRNRLLATILIGQNLFLSSASALATVIATAALGDSYGVPIAILFSTLTLFVFAEMTPKAIGAASPVGIARAVAIPLAWMMKLLAPIATLCVQVTTRALRFLHIA